VKFDSIFDILKKLNIHFGCSAFFCTLCALKQYVAMKKLIFVAGMVFSLLNIQAQDFFWGLTAAGGQNSSGIIYRTQSDGTGLTVIHSFNVANSGAFYPSGAMIRTPNGKLYGTTTGGGANGKGTIFEVIISSQSVSTKFSFNGTNGQSPWGAMVMSGNGKLYGLTVDGGSSGLGTVYEFDPETGTCVKKADFDGTAKGAHPWGSMVLASNGKFYGMTLQGGANDNGVLFEFDPTSGILTKKKDFSSIGISGVFGTLCPASNGKFYGVGETGGTSDRGTIFEYDVTTSQLVKVYDFTSSTVGDHPEGSLIEGTSGKLHGTTYFGGTQNLGVLYEYDLTAKTVTKKVDFTGANGASPNSSLMKAANGKLYGVTSAGGSAGKGVLFEYNPATGQYTKKIDFTGPNGASPDFTHLTEVRDLSGVGNLISQENLILFPNPCDASLTLMLELPDVSKLSIRLINVLGKTVFMCDPLVSPGTFRKNIDMSELPSGVYFVNVTAGKQVINRRIIRN
jgi:uncharacterized repeat protein (TIGR03803 family)